MEASGFRAPGKAYSKSAVKIPPQLHLSLSDVVVTDLDRQIPPAQHLATAASQSLRLRLHLSLHPLLLQTRLLQGQLLPHAAAIAPACH